MWVDSKNIAWSWLLSLFVSFVIYMFWFSCILSAFISHIQKIGKGGERKKNIKDKLCKPLNKLFHLNWVYFCNYHFSRTVIFKWHATSCYQLSPPLWAYDDRVPIVRPKALLLTVWSTSFMLLLKCFLGSSAFLWWKDLVDLKILVSCLTNYHKLGFSVVTISKSAFE